MKIKERSFSISSQITSSRSAFSKSAFPRSVLSSSAFSRSVYSWSAFSRYMFSRCAACGLRFGRGLCFRDIRQTPLKLGTNCNNIRFHKYLLLNTFKQPPHSAETWSETSPRIICWLFVPDMNPEIQFMRIVGYHCN